MVNDSGVSTQYLLGIPCVDCEPDVTSRRRISTLPITTVPLFYTQKSAGPSSVGPTHFTVFD